MFSDYTNVFTSAEAVEKERAQLNSELGNIYRWLVANRVPLIYDYWLSPQST